MPSLRILVSFLLGVAALSGEQAGEGLGYDQIGGGIFCQMANVKGAHRIASEVDLARSVDIKSKRSLTRSAAAAVAIDNATNDREVSADWLSQLLTPCFASVLLYDPLHPSVFDFLGADD